MSAKHTPGLHDARLEAARKLIEAAVLEHCRGGDLWLCTATAAQAILGDIIREATHHFGPEDNETWKRMPPGLRAAIAKATGSAS
jgi:hypothetical protein